jgi:hypothetical protein
MASIARLTGWPTAQNALESAKKLIDRRNDC